MDYHAQAGYPVAHQAQSQQFRAVHSIGQESPNSFDNRFNTPHYGQPNGYGYNNSTATLGQHHPFQQASSTSSKSSHANPPSPKRPRTDRQRQESTPSRLNTTGAQQSGLALPSNPLPEPHHYSSPYGHDDQTAQQIPPLKYQSYPVQSDQHTKQYHPAQPRNQSNQHGQDPQVQARRQEEIPSPLEEQVRSLAQHDRVTNEHNTAPSSEQPRPQAAVDQLQERTSGIPSFEIQQGARDGNALRLACQACSRRKYKCSRNFPCSECHNSHTECVPRTRKRKHRSDSTPAEQTPIPNETSQDAAANSNSNDTLLRKPLLDLNSTGKYFINLPPIIGGYWYWSNMRLKYDPIPSDVDSVRDKMFALESPVLLNSQQYSDYWPHITNLYNRSVAPTFESNGTQIEVWECRNQRRQARHRRQLPSQGQGKRNRKKKTDLLESDAPCKMRFRMISYVKHADTDEDHKGGLSICRCVPEWVHFEKTQSAVPHNHSLMSLDLYKRSDALLHFARHKVEEGPYMYAAVKKWIQAKYGDVSKQVECLRDQDVANAGRAWRLRNRDVELLETIEDPSPEKEEQEKCLALVGTATADGLRKALAEIITQVPAAIDLALQYLEAAQETLQRTDGDGDGVKHILEGNDIQVPEPGMPTRIKKDQPWLSDPTNPGHAQIGATAEAGASTLTLVPQLPPGKNLPWIPRQQAYAPPRPSQQAQQPRNPVINRHLAGPFHPQARQPQSSPSQIHPSSTLMIEGEQMTYAAPYGGRTIALGGHQYYPPSIEVIPSRSSTDAFSRARNRPTWAMPTKSSDGAGKASGKEESKEEKVARQLEAELQVPMRPSLVGRESLLPCLRVER